MPKQSHKKEQNYYIQWGVNYDLQLLEKYPYLSAILTFKRLPHLMSRNIIVLY